MCSKRWETWGSSGDRTACAVPDLNPDAQRPWEWYFQEHLVEALRQLGETQSEVEVVEQAVHDWRKTIQFKGKVTFNFSPNDL